MAQVVERLVRDQEAGGSSPLTPTNRRTFVFKAKVRFIFLFMPCDRRRRHEVIHMIESIRAYYETHDEDGRLETRHGRVEYETTMAYLERYLEPGMRIIDIGAGTGIYSHALAGRGCYVDAVELVERNIAVFRTKTKPGENVTIRQGDATDLSPFLSDTYDLTMLLGPMYHLFSETAKQKALSEALRVTKPGGVVFAAYCISDASILVYGFKKGHIFELIEKGMLETEHCKAFSRESDIFELHRKEDIDALMAPFPVTRLHYVATDLYTNHMRDTIDAMDEASFALYLKYHLAICARPDMVGLTHHSLDIFRKG